MQPDFLAFQAFVIVCATAAFVASLWFVKRVLELRHERALRNPAPDDLTDRLHRIEIAVEATAVEVERIAEANRFMAKLLADRGVPAAALPKQPERVITPH
jgi:hypothetical protein